tara:strand:+ start:851 stop:1093 length:243 start_codon:yes stop_codon:yes gene_type:complete
MKTNIYDPNFESEIKNYTISGLKEQISECVDEISNLYHNLNVLNEPTTELQINTDNVADKYYREIKLLKKELRRRNKVAQ